MRAEVPETLDTTLIQIHRSVVHLADCSASLEGAYKSSTMADGNSYSRQLQQSSDISLSRQSPQHQSEQLEPQNSKGATSVGGNKMVRTTNQALHADSVGDEVMFEQQRYTSRYSLLQKLVEKCDNTRGIPAK